MKPKGTWTVGRTVALILLAVAICTAGFFGLRYMKTSSAVYDGGAEAYVTSVALLTEESGSGGMVNRFSGVVESPETWSVDPNSEYKVAAVLVSVGQEVTEGQALFTYDVNTFQDSLAGAGIELERLNAELKALDDTINELYKEQKKAEQKDRAGYTIQIKQQELERKQKEYDITAKKAEIQKIQENINNSTVYSKISGVVQSINDGQAAQGSGMDGSDSGFIKIMKTGDLRVKGTVNEQNIGQIYEDMPIIIRSRVDKTVTWHGTVSSIDRENSQSNPYASMYGSEGGSSSNYPFYVELLSSEGLMMGQHVYLEPDFGQDELEEKTGIWIDAYFVDETDEPYVWADDNGKLVKKPVTIGERDEELGKVQIVEGLAVTDLLAFPEDTLREGMPTVDTARMTEEVTEEEFDEAA